MTFSLTSVFQKDCCRNDSCRACGLYLNQDAIYDEQKRSDIFWVGLSAVLFKDADEKLPLSPATASGALIQEIEEPFRSQLIFYKTNLVKCVPLKEDKIRYPLELEMENCFSNFKQELQELKPRVVFLLGRQVATFIFKRFGLGKPSFNEDFLFSGVEVNGVCFVPIQHPSYILVYKRKSAAKYIRSVQRFFTA